MVRTRTATDDSDLAVKRQNIQAELEAIGDDAPDEARSLIARADALLKQHDAKVEGLREAAAEIDETFQVRARERREQEEWERTQRTRAQVEKFAQAREATLDAVDEMERLLRSFNAARERAIANNQIANECVKVLSGGTWGAFSERGLVEHLSANMARDMYAANGKRQPFGRNCNFIPPPAPVHVHAADVKKSWRQREEEREAGAVERVLSRIGGANGH